MDLTPWLGNLNIQIVHTFLGSVIYPLVFSARGLIGVNYYQLAKTNGSMVEQRVCEIFGLNYINDRYDAEKDGEKYEIKSCEEYITDGKRKRKGRFIIEEKDRELMEEGVTFIFVVHNGDGKLRRCAWVNGKRLLRELNISRNLSWESLLLHVDKLYYDL